MIHIEKGLVPFWDDYLIDYRFTDAVLSVNQPVKTDIAITFDNPWDGNDPHFFTMVRDDGKYRLYYEACSWNDPEYPGGPHVGYAESTDGIHWERPNLGICEFRGSKENNLIMLNIHDSFYVMKDDNPACPPEHRYKALLSSDQPLDHLKDFSNKERGKGKSLMVMVSADGIHFEEYCVISRGYLYDTINSLHWNPHAGKYYCYIRAVHIYPKDPATEYAESHVRAIWVMESEDFIHWSELKPIRYAGGEEYPMYTNGIMAYPFDTRYYIGFPTRYTERKFWTANYDRLCGREEREKRCQIERRLGTVVTDCVFMSSRDNENWYRFDEACLSPGPEYFGNWVYGDCYPAVGGLVETPSRFQTDPNELSIYVHRNSWTMIPNELVRYTYRIDGFASVKADYSKKTLRTKHFTFDGEVLKMNFRTSGRGSVHLKILDVLNTPITGYKTCPMFGDSLDRIVDFEKPLAELQGREIALEFEMQDAELFALRFE